jgi:hypothetical protein
MKLVSLHSEILWWDMTHLEASGAPVHELDGPFRLDGSNCSIHILGNNVTPLNMGITQVRRETLFAV